LAGWRAGGRAIDDEFWWLSLVSSAAAVAAFVAVVAEELRCSEVRRGAWNDPGLIVAGFELATFAGLFLLSSTSEGRGKQPAGAIYTYISSLSVIIISRGVCSGRA
jgi:hypothetical protein